MARKPAGARKRKSEPNLDSRAAREMRDHGGDGLRAYRLTKEEGDTAMRRLQHQGADEPFLNGDVGSKLQAEGGLVGKLARHCQKWLRDENSETTIPLTAAEHKEVTKLVGHELKEA